MISTIILPLPILSRFEFEMPDLKFNRSLAFWELVLDQTQIKKTSNHFELDGLNFELT